MKINKIGKNVSFEDMTEFEAQTILRCVQAIGCNLFDSKFDLYQVFVVNDRIQELGFSDEEMNVINTIVAQLPKLEKRPLYDKSHDL